MEPCGIGGLGVLNPSLLLHGASVSTPALARIGWRSQDLLCRGKGFGWDFRGLVAIRAPRPNPLGGLSSPKGTSPMQTTPIFKKCFKGSRLAKAGEGLKR